LLDNGNLKAILLEQVYPTVFILKLVQTNEGGENRDDFGNQGIED